MCVFLVCEGLGFFFSLLFFTEEWWCIILVGLDTKVNPSLKFGVLVLEDVLSFCVSMIDKA